MPLEALLPKIDDRRYDDIVSEARARIPRYTSEWTDLNDGEPGMALVQLLAWMTDLLLYRLGKVPENNYLKFLQLIGIELQAAEPAQAEITFPLTKTAASPYILIPARTQISAEGRPPIVFETNRAIAAIKAPIVSLLVFDGFAFADHTTDNQQADQPFFPFGSLATVGSALMLGFDPTDPFPEITLELAFFAGGARAAKVADCGLPPSVLFAPAQIVWEYWDGTQWKPLSVPKDETNAFLRSGHVFLKLPAKGKVVPAAFAGTSALYWLRARLSKAAYERSPQLQAVRTNTVPATQAQTARDEVLGGSDGQTNIQFTLANAPVIAGTLRLEIDEGQGFEPWTEVADFFSSRPDDKVYRLNRTTGHVLFSDAVNGAIPATNVNNLDGNIVAREYRFGGGAFGNVSCGTIKTLLGSIPDVEDQNVGNLLPAVGGRDEESLDDAKRRAPAAIRSRCRAVTADDFEYLAKQAGNVRRAFPMPLAHPSFPGVEVPGAVTVVIVPDSDAPNPLPSEATLRTVCAYLNQRRLLTTELFVVAPEYNKIDVCASLIAENEADLGFIVDAAAASLTKYFHPLTGGEEGTGWPFGGAIYFSRVFQRLLDTPGVARVESVVISIDGADYPVCQDVPIPRGHLLYSGVQDVQANYAFDETA
jgi:predicted phage baseplate assembly protein